MKNHSSTAPLIALLRSIAQDLRTPIGVVEQSLVSLRDAPHAIRAGDDGGAPAPPGGDHQTVLSLADCSVRGMTRLADTLSLLAAVEAPGFALHRRVVDLAGLVRAASESAVDLALPRAIRVECDVGSTTLEAAVDPVRVAHAITELIVNALRHACARIRIVLVRRGTGARITIEDDGSGVPDARRATLFHRLTGRPSDSGLGVGLSLARHVVRAHHGALTLASSTLPPGRPGTVGARFVCALPLGLVAPRRASKSGSPGLCRSSASRSR